jgi:type I restriction enzyme S subunit
MAKNTEKRTAAHWEWPVPKSWAWVRISEVANVIGGGTPSTTRYEFWEGGKIPWITPADLTGYNEREISRGARFITQAGLDNSSARLLPARSVLFSSRAPVGYVAIAANPLATNQGFKSFVLSEGILPEYLYFYLRRAKEQITKLASGTSLNQLCPVFIDSAHRTPKYASSGIIDNSTSRMPRDNQFCVRHLPAI